MFYTHYEQIKQTCLLVVGTFTNGFFMVQKKRFWASTFLRDNNVHRTSKKDLLHMGRVELFEKVLHRVARRCKNNPKMKLPRNYSMNMLP